MLPSQTVLKGVIHGKHIEIEGESGFPDGQKVTILLSPVWSPGDGIQRSAGGWSDAGNELDLWLEEIQKSRHIEQHEIS